MLMQISEPNTQGLPWRALLSASQNETAKVTSCIYLLTRTSLQDPLGQLREGWEGYLGRTQVLVPQELQAGACGYGYFGWPLGTSGVCGMPSTIIPVLVCLPGLLG